MPELSRLVIARLQKVATDNGFSAGNPIMDWVPISIPQGAFLNGYLRPGENSTYLVGFADPIVVRALEAYGTPIPAPLQVLTCGGFEVPNMAALHRLLRHAVRLARTLPDELDFKFGTRTSRLPNSTEAERMVVQRVGQEVFRDALLELWDGRCSITRLAVPELLRASHIKPWADCDSDAERLDVFNGFLLAPQLDAAFDRGFITVLDDGRVQVSDALTPADRTILGLSKPLTVRGITSGHRSYLPWHRERIYRGPG